MIFKRNYNLFLNLQVLKYSSSQLLEYVPKYNPVLNSDLFLLKEFIQKYNKILVITGAGISTESGIPDYRSEGVGLYARTDKKPILYQTFLKSSFARQRYWARNFVGWPRFSSCLPNDVHYSVKKLEDENKLSCIVTQNVDNLHFRAESKKVIELHGSTHRIVCINCDNTMSRHEFQKILSKLNTHMNETTTMIRPDGDVEIPEDEIESFRVPQCAKCGGIYKPDVIFFGDNVPKPKVKLVSQNVANSDSVLVLGSSLTVYSIFRFILQAKELNLPLAIVNIGPTRADGFSDLKISTKCGDILPRVCKELFI